MRCRRIALLGIALSFSIRGQLAAADWPHFLGPDYDNTSTETGLLHDWPANGPRLLWEYAKGEGHSAPAIGGGRVVVFHAERKKEIVDALDAATGQRAWRFEYDAPFTPQYGGGSGPCTNPTITAGRVFTLGISSRLHCLDLATGKVVWQRDLARDYDLLPTFFGQGGTPLVLGERLIVSLGTQDQKSLVALDVATGKELWAAQHPWGSSYSSPIPASLHGRECVLAFQGGMEETPNGGLLVIDAKTGAVLSAVPHRAKMFASVNVSAPVAVGSRVFIAEAYTEGGLCVEIAPDFSAKTAWAARKSDTYLTTAVPYEGHLYGWVGMHQQNAALACYDIATGKEQWRDDLGGKFQRASLIRADGAFLCLGENGDLAWLDLSPKGGAVRTQAKLFHAPETWTPPVVSDGRLFICQNEPGSGGTKPRVICYDLKRK
jgi:outer membrane protein assembly factor BamB